MKNSLSVFELDQLFEVKEILETYKIQGQLLDDDHENLLVAIDKVLNIYKE